MPSTKSKTRGRKTHRGPSQASQDAQAAVELAVTTINNEAPDYLAFMARFSDRYGAANLQRLWVQCPRATQLHKLGTWHGYGRKVKTGEKAIWLRIPHHGRGQDDAKITEDNPTGETTTFTGAPFTAMFDFSQTIDIDAPDDYAPDADPSLVAEVRKLRAEAIRIHPDVTGDTSQAGARAFSAAWDRFETAKARMAGAR